MINRYKNIPKIKSDGKLCYKTSRYPEVPLSENDIYVITSRGDRFDTLAQQYYGDSSLWWVISIANTAGAGTALTANLSQSTLVIPEGIQIRIPNNPIEVYNTFNQINS
jgi:hypothetical protein